MTSVSRAQALLLSHPQVLGSTGYSRNSKRTRTTCRRTAQPMQKRPGKCTKRF